MHLEALAHRAFCCYRSPSEGIANALPMQDIRGRFLRAAHGQPHLAACWIVYLAERGWREADRGAATRALAAIAQHRTDLSRGALMTLHVLAATIIT